MTENAKQRKQAFEHAMKMEAHFRECEYSVADHAEKAKMHQMRWYWLDKAVAVLSDKAEEAKPSFDEMDAGQLREKMAKMAARIMELTGKGFPEVAQSLKDDLEAQGENVL